MVVDQRRFPYFHTFCFGVALVKEKLHLASVSARPCRYLSVYQNIPNGVSAMAIFAEGPRADRRTEELTWYF